MSDVDTNLQGLIPEVPPCPLDPAEIADEQTLTSSNTEESNVNVSRKDKFYLIFSLPPCFKGIKKTFTKVCNPVNEDQMQYSIYGTILPAVNMPKMSKPYAGQTMVFSSHSRQEYAPVTVNFTIDSEWENYYVIWKWMDIIADELEGGFDAKNVYPALKGKLGSYATTMVLYGLNEYNAPKVQFNYHGAFPIGLQNVTYNYRDGGELECSFTFAFSQLEMALV